MIIENESEFLIATLGPHDCSYEINHEITHRRSQIVICAADTPTHTHTHLNTHMEK